MSAEQKLKNLTPSGILSKNCWLIPVDTGLAAYCQIVAEAEKNKIRHQSLFFEKKPEWVTFPPAKPVVG